jgi:hypothetical protein
MVHHGLMTQTTVLAGAASPEWKTIVIARSGTRRQSRINTALSHASDISLYPYRLEVAVVLAEPGWGGGLPAAAETRRLAGIEEKVITAVAGRALLAEVVASGGSSGSSSIRIPRSGRPH